MSSSLTTRFLFKQQAGISGTTDDTLIDRLILDVSDAIERRCDRVFGTATYRHWLDGTGTKYLLLPQYPITNVYMVTDESDNVLTITFSGGEEASVSVTDTSVLLHSVSTAGAETNTSTLTFATYKIVSTLAAAIAAVSGWSATIESSMSTRPTALLRPMWAEDATDPNDATLIIASESSKIRVSYLTQRAIESSDGFIFPCGRQNIFIWYVAGYTLPVDNSGHSALETTGNLPGGLVLAVNGILNDVYLARRRDRTLQSESLGDYSYSNAQVSAAIDSHWRELSPYVRKSA